MTSVTQQRPARPNTRLTILPALGALAALAMGAAQRPLDTNGDAKPIDGGAWYGVLVDAGGLTLHLHCRGAGRPTVILERGLGDHMDTWLGIQVAAARQSRVCLYDRAGTGWSEPDHQPTTMGRTVRNLRTVLDNGGVGGPYVLVGHGLGGLLVRRFAADHPQDVAAMLLIDSGHENQARRVSETVSDAATAADRSGTRYCEVEAPMKLLRAPGLVNAYHPISGPENLRPMHADAIERTRFCATVREEAVALRAVVSSAEPPRDLGDLPLIVLTPGRGMAVDPLFSRVGISDSAIAAWDVQWLQLQAELAALSTNSKHRIVEDASHFIQLDRPDVVIDAIRELVEIHQGRRAPARWSR